MCVAGEEELSGSSGGSAGGAGGGGSGDGAIPEIVVTAPRLGLNMSLIEAIDWAEVAKIAGFAAAGGAYSGGWSGALGAGLAAGAGAIEGQDGVDLEDLIVIKNDMIVVPGSYPYVPLY
ncbi:MAG TPA: hypothetical protein VF210_18170 [Pseudomonadales bacterium]